MYYNKLVRDNIPEILREKNVSFTADTLDVKAFELALGSKLVEEAIEFRESGDMEELADLFEVVDAILAHNHWNEEDVRKIQKEKAAKRGGFAKRILLIEAD